MIENLIKNYIQKYRCTLMCAGPMSKNFVDALTGYRSNNKIPLIYINNVIEIIEQKLLENFFEKASKLKLVIRISPKRYFIPVAIRNLAKIAEELGNKERNGKLNIKTFQTTICIGRNLTIDILEFFDKIGFTKRFKDERLILKSALDILK